MTPLHDDRSGFERGCLSYSDHLPTLGEGNPGVAARRSLRLGREALPDEHALMILAHFMRFCSQGQPIADEF